MAYRVILDTSTAINLLKRSDQKILDAIKEEQPEEVVITGVTKYELEIGNKQNDKRISGIPCISMGCEDFTLAAGMMLDLSNKGKKPKLKDCFIAAIAIDCNALLLTSDNDFEIFRDFGLQMRLV